MGIWHKYSDKRPEAKHGDKNGCVKRLFSSMERDPEGVNWRPYVPALWEWYDATDELAEPAPPEGYEIVTFAVGELVQEGDLAWQCLSLKWMPTLQAGLPTSGTHYARKIKTPQPRPLGWYDAKTDPPTEADENNHGDVLARKYTRDEPGEFGGQCVRSHPELFDKWCPLPKLPPYPTEPEPEEAKVTEQPTGNNDWIPTPGNGWPGQEERFPTEVDGTKNRLGQLDVEITGASGYVCHVPWSSSGFGAGNFVAWKRVSSPYVRPEPEPTDDGERLHIWVCGNEWFAHRDNAVEHSKPEMIAVSEFVHVLPGDPTPKQVREVVKEMDDLQSGWDDRDEVSIAKVRQWLNKLEGK